MSQKTKKHLPKISIGHGHGAGKIPAPVPPPDYVVFSFKYLDLTSNSKFSLEHCPDPRQYAEKFLERLKAVNSMTVMDLRNPSKAHALRCHTITWDQTSEDGFPVNSTLREHEPLQFEISANAHGRVHGFFIGNTFFIVWLDPAHKLYGN